MYGLIPYDIDLTWKIEDRTDPKLFCQGCRAEVEHDGYGYNTQHNILDCVQELQRRISKLEEVKSG